MPNGLGARSVRRKMLVGAGDGGPADLWGWVWQQWAEWR